MESDGFHYSEAQWDEIAKHVEAAGGAKDRLDTHRVTLEKLITIWKRRFDKTESKAREKDLQAKALARRCKEMKAKSANLKAVLSKLTRDDPLWEPLAEKLAKMSSTLDLEQPRRGRGRPENKRKLLFNSSASDSSGRRTWS